MGGTGGCKGSTPGLGFDYWQNNGVRLVGDETSKDDKDFAYLGKDETVPKKLCDSNQTAGDVSLTSFAQVANNDLVSLMFAIREFGPAAVAVDATCFSGYNGGVMDHEKCGTTLNHAVLAVGYGKDADGTCWLKIRNSWGPQWGECRDHTTTDCADDDRGFIRIARQCLPENAVSAPQVCGMDTSTKDGLGCIGAKKNLHPRNTMVCGTAGVLYKPLVITNAEFAPGFVPKLKEGATSQQDEMKAKCAKQGMIVDVASCNKDGCKCATPPADANECKEGGVLAECLQSDVLKYCFGAENGGAPGCDTKTGKLATTGMFGRCGKEAHACAVCYPKSPCGAKA